MVFKIGAQVTPLDWLAVRAGFNYGKMPLDAVPRLREHRLPGRRRDPPHAGRRASTSASTSPSTWAGCGRRPRASPARTRCLPRARPGLPGPVRPGHRVVHHLDDPGRARRRHRLQVLGAPTGTFRRPAGVLMEDDEPRPSPRGKTMQVREITCRPRRSLPSSRPAVPGPSTGSRHHERPARRRPLLRVPRRSTSTSRPSTSRATATGSPWARRTGCEPPRPDERRLRHPGRRRHAARRPLRPDAARPRPAEHGEAPRRHGGAAQGPVGPAVGREARRELRRRSPAPPPTSTSTSTPTGRSSSTRPAPPGSTSCAPPSAPSTSSRPAPSPGRSPSPARSPRSPARWSPPRPSTAGTPAVVRSTTSPTPPATTSSTCSPRDGTYFVVSQPVTFDTVGARHRLLRAEGEPRPRHHRDGPGPHLRRLVHAGRRPPAASPAPSRRSRSRPRPTRWTSAFRSTRAGGSSPSSSGP